MNWDERVEKWFENVMSYAKNNYGVRGWDNFVECVGLSDFKRDAHDYDWQTRDDAFIHYENWCELKAEQREDALGDSGAFYEGDHEPTGWHDDPQWDD